MYLKIHIKLYNTKALKLLYQMYQLLLKNIALYPTSPPIVFSFPLDIVSSCKPLDLLCSFDLLVMYTSIFSLSNDILVFNDICVLYRYYFSYTSDTAKGEQSQS